MIDMDLVFAKAKVLIGFDLDEGQDKLLLELCSVAKVEIYSRLKDGFSFDEIEEELYLALAFLGASLYLDTVSSEVSALAVGSLSVKYGESSHYRELSKKFRQQSDILLSGYTEDENFAFKAVK